MPTCLKKKKNSRMKYYFKIFLTITFFHTVKFLMSSGNIFSGVGTWGGGWDPKKIMRG